MKFITFNLEEDVGLAPVISIGQQGQSRSIRNTGDTGINYKLSLYNSITNFRSRLQFYGTTTDS